MAKHGYKYNVFGHLPPPNTPTWNTKVHALFPNTPHLNPHQHQSSITVVEFHVPRSYLSVRNASGYHQGEGQPRQAM